MKKLKICKLTASLALLGVSSLVTTAQAQIMFSQYVDGSGNRKGLEIYNPDGQSVNLDDYEIRQFTNGSKDVKTTYALTGSLASQGRHLLGRNELKNEAGVVVHQVANLAFNGDDTLVLYYKNTPVDRFGVIGEQPENGWGVKTPSKGNSFSRKTQKNEVSSIDPYQQFDLDQSWTAWSNRNDFSQLSGAKPSEPPVLSVLSCSSQDTPIAALHTAAHNQAYTIRGVVTADYRYDNGFSGFYVQTPDSKALKDRSNAIFVYVPTSSTVKGGTVGQEVILKGRLTQYQNQLQLDQLDQHVQEIKACNSNVKDWVKPLELRLPFAGLGQEHQHRPQQYQGMLVTLPQILTISENYNYGRFGELSLSLGRLFIPTNLYPAGSAEAKQLAQTNLLSKIVLDDGYNQQNLTPWLPTAFNANNSLRAGAQLKNVQGILEYRFNSWRVQPVLGAAKPTIQSEQNPRAHVLQKQPEQIRVVAFNVLNYDNGATGFPTERGADNQQEFDRQHAKIVDALKKIDADVYGLMEIANNGFDDRSALAYLTRSLGSDWKYVIPEGHSQLGTDAIAVAIIYNSKRVNPVNKPAVLDLGNKNRTTIAQSFQAVTGGKIFTVVPNHLKSKGSCDDQAAAGDLDQGDGQSCWNETRVRASEQLIQWLAKDPTGVKNPNALILGDINAYAKEDPILTFERANYKALLNDEKIGQGKNAYSYVFGVASNAQGYGGAGNLDHILSDASITPSVTRAFTWQINADEPTLLDYNTEYKTAQQIEDFYAADAYRSSDHDPIIVDLKLTETEDQPEPQPEPPLNTDKDKAEVSGGSSSVFAGLMIFLMALTSLWLRRTKT